MAQVNILFGKPHNMLLYGHIIDSCALGPDLEILPRGDQTEISEKVKCVMYMYTRHTPRMPQPAHIHKGQIPTTCDPTYMLLLYSFESILFFLFLHLVYYSIFIFCS